MKYRILFHSHVFVHKAHAVFFRLSEPRKVLIMADYPLIGMQFFRGPCFSRSAVHRQIAGDFETFAPVFLALVRLAGQDHAGSRGDREQEFRLTWSKTEASLIVEDRGTSLVSSFPVEFRHTYSHAFSMFRIPAQGNDGVLRPTAVGQNHRECGLSGHDIRLDSHIGFHPVEHEPCIVWAGPVKLPVANDDLIARQHYGDDCSHVRKQAYHLRRAFPPFHPLRPRASADALRRIGVIRRFGSVGGFPFLGGVPFLRGFPSFLDHSLSFPFPILEVFHGSYKQFSVC